MASAVPKDNIAIIQSILLAQKEFEKSNPGDRKLIVNVNQVTDDKERTYPLHIAMKA